MNTPKALSVICGLIVILAFIAAATGIFWRGAGGHYEVTSLRGQAVPIWGSGLYRFDSVAGAAQEIAQDLVTLVVGIPLLLGATVLAARGSLRGRILRAGTLGYFLYTYTAMAMLTAYNELFLVYVALLSLSLFGFILALLAIDVARLPAHFTATFPRRTIAGFVLFVGAMLTLLWLGLIGPPLLAGIPPAGLESYTTLVIQALDLGIVVPTALLTGVLLLRRAAVGYLLAAVVLVKAFTMGLATSAMVVGQILAGVAVSPVVALVFFAFAASDIVLLILMLRSLSDVPRAEGPSLLASAPPGVAGSGEHLVPVQRGFGDRNAW